MGDMSRPKAKQRQCIARGLAFKMRVITEERAYVGGRRGDPGRRRVPHEGLQRIIVLRGFNSVRRHAESVHTMGRAHHICAAAGGPPGLVAPFAGEFMARSPTPEAPRPPLWHPSRLGWVNGLGFALSMFFALFLLCALVSALLNRSQPLEFAFPRMYAYASLATLVILGLLTCFLIFGVAWKGADFGTHRARNMVFLWSLAGLLFFLVQTLVLFKFGSPRTPYIAEWASDLYWGIAPVGFASFALMTYVNYAAAHDPALDDNFEEHSFEEHDYDARDDEWHDDDEWVDHVHE